MLLLHRSGEFAIWVKDDVANYNMPYELPDKYDISLM